MDTDKLRYFAAVAKYGSITQAAKAMYISQPQLSHIIRELEEETGMTLLRRSSQGTNLTRDGERVLEHCVAIIREMDSLQNLISSAKVEEGRLNVCMTRFSHTAECFDAVCRRYQDIASFSGRLIEGSTRDVIRQVEEGSENIGVLHFTSSNQMAVDQLAERDLLYTPLASFQPYVCLAADHELIRTYGRKGIELEALSDYGFVRYLGQFEDFIYHIATKKGTVDLNQANKIIYVNDRLEQMHLISVTNFYTVGIMEFQGQDALYNVVSVPLLNCQESLQFGYITRREPCLSRPEQDFIEELKKRYHKLER